ncbi:hypothetical protein AJ80_08983 [Polytolypa hystricis UAMH7299]|uniref:Uncharacterized protein n=1 Tax=Polytolypa hystricis (strain UAMH7299) TaxID=1447883 RepID=A0A2B7WYI1_POLH7|nr:hypothetical protein AJ80_08983 [Polytolypa hystricis UAMH7299]
MSYYLSKPIPKFYYDQIKKPGSEENAVGKFWNNTLPHYFTQDKLYGIEQEQRPLEGVVKQHADFTIRYTNTIRYIKNRIPKKLTEYLKLVRAEQEDSEEVLYAAVTIGTYVRFYCLTPDDQTLTDYPTTRTGDYYELKNRIHLLSRCPSV